MVADTIFTGKDEQTEKKEDNSVTIFVVGRVSCIAGIVQLDPQTRLHCRRAVKEYYQRTKIINRRRNGSVVDTRITNKVYLAITSFDRRKRERNEAIEQIRCCFDSHEYIPQEHILEIREGKFSLEGFATAIKTKEFPSSVIIIGNEFSFTWRNPFTWKNPLATGLKKFGITPEFLETPDPFFVPAVPF
ncbi:MAG: hypothetical protein Q7S11_04870 [bacterium]|nr:hypothetical protein [bacterium]